MYEFVEDRCEAINKPVDNVRYVDIGQVNESFNKLKSSGSIPSQEDEESDVTVRNFKIQSTTKIPSGGNFSVKNLYVGNNVHVVKSQVVHQYEIQTKDIYNSYSENLYLFEVNHK